MAFSVRQEKFCLEYAKSGNATEAYKLAGYTASDEAARRNASRLLTNADVQARLQELQQETAIPAIADAQEIQSLLTEAMRNCAANGDVLGICKTADILNKMHGAYVNKTELTSNAGGTLQFVWEVEGNDSG